MGVRLTVGRKVVGLAALGLAFLLAVGLVALTGLLVVEGVLRESAIHTQAARNQSDIDMMHDALRGDVFAALAAAEGRGDGERVARLVEAHAARMRAGVEKNEALPLDADTKAALLASRSRIESYIKTAERLVSLAAIDRGGAAGEVDGFMRAFDVLEKDLASASDRIEVAATRLRELSDARMRAAVRRTAAVALVALASLLGAAAVVTRSITRPLGQAVIAARHLAQGDIAAGRIDGLRAGGDEVGEIVGALAETAGYLREAARTAETLARGDLTVQVGPRSRGDVLGHAFSQMIEGLRGLVGHVREGAADLHATAGELGASSARGSGGAEAASRAIEELTATIHELSANVQQVAGNAGGQATSASGASAAVEEMVASIRTVSGSSATLVELARRSAEAVQGGQHAVVRSTEGMGRISSVIGQSAETIEVLGGRAQEIGRIVGVIEDLADQTNLLALNAAIEAARAAEHGLGFAVVAEEVRRLAERSQASTKEIAELIGAIQREAAAAVARMRESRETVREGLSLSEAVTGALTRIDAAVAEVTRLSHEIGAATTAQAAGGAQVAREMTRLDTTTREIDTAMREQASGARQVVQAAERMREVTRLSAVSAAENRTAVETLATSAESLEDAVARFRLETGA
jgi:methyl-accepting chemotaxis protein